MAKTRLKLGTRKSLLAWAQSSWVAREVERLNPGVQVELVGIETRGDVILDVSLNKIEGKEFFVAELDHALRDGKVDFTVHSMKDLSLERPEIFICGAVPQRENPRDVILFGPGVMERLAAGEKLRIGTSSPRRIENIPAFLESALPALHGSRPSVELVEIRGNVNTRLGRVHEPAGAERHLDGVVLAFAGIIRLWNDSEGQRELTKLLSGCKWMILPLRECPAAPAQGALAVECRRNDEVVRGYLAQLHDSESQDQVSLERSFLALWGGGCHQRFGATVLESPAGRLLSIRGAKSSGESVDELRWNAPKVPAGSAAQNVWDGGKWRTEAERSDTRLQWQADLSGKTVFVTHARAVDSAHATQLKSSRVWTSGTASWYKLAALGVWVEGCCESLGFDAYQENIESVQGLAPLSEWVVLTHEGAQQEWAMAGKVIATYSVHSTYSEQAKETLKRADVIYWSSGSQFEELHSLAKPGAFHACGLGKTAARIRKKESRSEVLPQVFPSIQEWRKWTQMKSL